MLNIQTSDVPLLTNSELENIEIALLSQELSPYKVALLDEIQVELSGRRADSLGIGQIDWDEFEQNETEGEEW